MTTTGKQIFTHLSVPNGAAVARARVPVINRKVAQGLVSLGELKDTHHQLGAIASVLMDVAVRTRHGSKIGVAKKYAREIAAQFAEHPVSLLKALVGLDLNWKYGIKPLIKDCNNVMSSLGRVDKSIAALKKDFVVEGFFRDSKTTPNYSTYNTSTDGNYGFYRSDISYTKTTTTEWTEGAVRRLDNTKLPTIDRLRLQGVLEDLGLTPDLSSIVALVPYSFVADWFFPISNYLEQMRGMDPQPEWFTTVNTWSTVKSITNGVLTETLTPVVAGALKHTRTIGLPSRAQEWGYTTYSRSALLGPTWTPTTPYIPEPRMPTLAQWASIAELAFARIYRLPTDRRSSWSSIPNP
jgi:hypothetical protein